MTLETSLFDDLSDFAGPSDGQSGGQAGGPSGGVSADAGRALRGGGTDAPILAAALTEALQSPAADAVGQAATGGDASLGDMLADTPTSGPGPAGDAPGAADDTGAVPATATAIPVATAAPVDGDHIPSDPLYVDQWHFPLMGDIETIWDEYTGAGVHVYVADDGVEYTHEDLAGNYDATMHFTHDGVTYDPMPSFRDGHGTSCAGLIAAVEGNDLGGTGVAYGATLTGLNFITGTQYLSLEIMMASLEWAENFDVMSNSWGITPSYGSYQSPFDTIVDNTQDDTVAVFGEVLANGRGGLGTVIMQASGNDTRNAQGDAVNGTRFTASIAATDEFGFATYYTNYGTNILVTAPAGAVTTDLTGFPGYDRGGNYTDEFGGTSAATPITAGVVALMLEANADLGWRDVHNILAASASHTGSAYDAITTATYEQGLWFANDATTWNGGGMMFDLTYGYGMVDAYAAVRMAEVWLDIHGDAQVSTNEEHVSVSFTTATALADNATTLVSITVARNIAIENIQVSVDMTHTNASNLEIWLVSPDGTEFMLFRNEGGSSLMDNGFEWIFGVEAARGMYSAGEWELMVIDETAGNIGALDAVTLDFYGSARSSTEVHTLTDDFAALVAIDPTRGVFADIGGHDVLNMVAVSGNIEADMAKGAELMVDGVLWGTFQVFGGNFEDIYAGDGDDILYGNNTGNMVSGMRGDDELYGRNGMDTIDGGAGDDYISAGAQSDWVLGGDGADILRGGGQADLVEGGVGDDSLRGQRGDDTLDGGAGNDTLNGGEHSDILIGGDGNDVFQFFEGFGQDTITDFTQGEDVIDVSSLSAITDFTDLSNAHLSDSGIGAVVTALGYSFTIDGVFSAVLTQDDFIF